MKETRITSVWTCDHCHNPIEMDDKKANAMFNREGMPPQWHRLQLGARRFADLKEEYHFCSMACLVKWSAEEGRRGY